MGYQSIYLQVTRFGAWNEADKHFLCELILYLVVVALIVFLVLRIVKKKVN